MSHPVITISRLNSSASALSQMISKLIWQCGIDDQAMEWDVEAIMIEVRGERQYYWYLVARFLLELHRVCLNASSHIHSQAHVSEALLCYIEYKQLASSKGRHVVHTMFPYPDLLASSTISTTREDYSALRLEGSGLLFSSIYSIVRTTGHGADIAADCLHRTIYP